MFRVGFVLYEVLKKVIYFRQPQINNLKMSHGVFKHYPFYLNINKRLCTRLATWNFPHICLMLSKGELYGISNLQQNHFGMAQRFFIEKGS